MEFVLFCQLNHCQQNFAMLSFSWTTTGGSAVGADYFYGDICVAQGYAPDQPLKGCLVFNGESFASMGIIDGVTSTTTWTSVGVPQSISFVTDKMANANGCVFPDPVAPPVNPPVEPPVAPPVVPPVAPPVEPPVAPPIVPPVAPPVALPATAPVVVPVVAPVVAPVAAPIVAPVVTPVVVPVVTPVVAPVVAPVAPAPVTPPMTGGATSFIALILGAVLSIIGAMAAIFFFIC